MGKQNSVSAGPVSPEKLKRYLDTNATHLTGLPGYEEIAVELYRLASEVETGQYDLNELEQSLTALKERMTAIARTRQTVDDLFHIRNDVALRLRPYVGKMSTYQLGALQAAYLEPICRD